MPIFIWKSFFQETSDDAIRCYVIIGVLFAASGLLVLLMKETKGKALTDTLNQEQIITDPEHEKSGLPNGKEASNSLNHDQIMMEPVSDKSTKVIIS